MPIESDHAQHGRTRGRPAARLTGQMEELGHQVDQLVAEERPHAEAASTSMAEQRGRRRRRMPHARPRRAMRRQRASLRVTARQPPRRLALAPPPAVSARCRPARAAPAPPTARPMPSAEFDAAMNLLARGAIRRGAATPSALSPTPIPRTIWRRRRSIGSATSPILQKDYADAARAFRRADQEISQGAARARKHAEARPVADRAGPEERRLHHPCRAPGKISRTPRRPSLRAPAPSARNSKCR